MISLIEAISERKSCYICALGNLLEQHAKHIKGQDSLPAKSIRYLTPIPRGDNTQYPDDSPQGFGNTPSIYTVYSVIKLITYWLGSLQLETERRDHASIRVVELPPPLLSSPTPTWDWCGYHRSNHRMQMGYKLMTRV